MDDFLYALFIACNVITILNVVAIVRNLTRIKRNIDEINNIRKK